MSILSYLDMFTASFDFVYPRELIATHPLKTRSASRLYLIERNKPRQIDATFQNFSQYLCPGDLVVTNNSKVIKARFYGIYGTTTPVEFLYISHTTEQHRGIPRHTLTCMARPLKKLHLKDTVRFPDATSATITAKDETTVTLTLLGSGQSTPVKDVYTWLNAIGEMPLPPYIKRPYTPAIDDAMYQTIFANTEGSVAAPTASLHFDDTCIQMAKARGIEFTTITLHVGIGTFQPIRTTTLGNHKMHREYGTISERAATQINTAKARGNRIIAVGTTVIRTLESVGQKDGIVKAGDFDTDLFIYPGHHFRVVDGLITNFHQPQSSLFVCISAFHTREALLAAYQDAIEKRYRLFSYGDAMMIL